MPVNIAFSSVGRRVELIEQFRATLRSHGGGHIVALDLTDWASAVSFADEYWEVPPCTDAGFVDAVLDVCRSRDVSLVVPLIDTELHAYAESRSRFSAEGILVNVSGPETIALCADKEAFGEHVRRVARTPAAVSDRTQRTAPVVVKPARGSSSIGLLRFDRLADVPPALLRDPSLIVQEAIHGEEYSVDLFVDGVVRAAYVRQQVELRGGETSKGISIVHDDVRRAVEAAVETLPDPFGVLHADVIVERHSGEPVILEINARFPGGYPLSHRAGSPMIDWLLILASGGTPDYRTSPFRTVRMSRYEMGVYTDPSGRPL